HALAQTLEAADERGPCGRGGPRLVDEQTQLALLDGERALEREQPIADVGVAVEIRRRALELEADRRPRLQPPGVEIAREAHALLADRDVAHAGAPLLLVQQRAELARDDLGDRQQIRRRLVDAGEERAAGDASGLKRRGRDAFAGEALDERGMDGQ